MKLHARNLAISVGIPTRLVNLCVEFMIQKKSITKETALDFLKSQTLPISIVDDIKL